MNAAASKKWKIKKILNFESENMPFNSISSKLKRSKWEMLYWVLARNYNFDQKQRSRRPHVSSVQTDLKIRRFIATQNMLLR